MDRSQNADGTNSNYRTRRGVLTTLGSASIVALAGCSLGADDERSPTPTDGQPATPTRTEAPGPAPTPTGAPTATATRTASPSAVPPRVAVLSREARQALELSETNRGELAVPVAGGD